MTEDRSDAQLLREFRQGDLDAFAALVRRHQDAIYRLALRSLGDPELAPGCGPGSLPAGLAEAGTLAIWTW